LKRREINPGRGTGIRSGIQALARDYLMGKQGIMVQVFKIMWFLIHFSLTSAQKMEVET
jgi:hypothetical protein